MEKVILDSDIIIDFLRTGQGFFPRVLELAAQGKIEIYLSSVTVFELFAGNSVGKGEKYLLELTSNLKVIPFDFTLAKFAGGVKRDKKLSTALADFIIGVTSLFISAQLLTRNKKHFKGFTGIKFFKTATLL